jgi:hypothetical protein
VTFVPIMSAFVPEWRGGAKASRQLARQTVSLHFGVAAGQSLSSLHWTQRESAQMGAAAPQSVAVTQAAHFPRATSHLGVGAAHCVSAVQPATRHSSSTGSQIGAAVPQSAFDRHVTHLPFKGAQRGFVAGQSEFTAHDTQRFLVASQIGAVAGQSAAVEQPTHAPDATSQTLVSFFPQTVAAVAAVHAGWHD